MVKDNSSGQYAEVVTPIWWGLAAIHRKPPGPRRLRIRWFRLASTVVGLSAVFWLMAALGLYFWFKLGRGFQDEKFSMVLMLPFHWPPFHSAEHDKAMGDYYARMADLHLQNKRIMEAYNAYHLAVTKTPDNLDARSHYAQFSYMADKNVDHYFSILEDGLPYALADDPKHYIDNYFLELMKAQLPDRSDRIEKICRKYLEQNLVNPNVRNIFALNLAIVLIDKGDFDGADNTISKYQLEKTFDGVLVKSRLLWEERRPSTAIAYIEAALPRYNNNDYLLGLLSTYYRELGDLDKSRQYTMMRTITNPSNVAPRIELLYILAKTGDQVHVDHEVEDIIQQFHTNAPAMTMLASFATDQGNVKLALRLYQMAMDQDQQLRLAAQKSDFVIPSFALLVAEAYLTNNDYQDTLLFLDQIRQEKPDWLAQNQLLFDSMRAVADYGLGQDTEAEMYANALIESDKTDPQTLLLVANRFSSHGAMGLAARLLAEANHMDPHNQVILAQLIATNLQLGNWENMDKNIHALLQTNRPPLELLYDANRQLASDHFIFVADREKLLAELSKYIDDAVKNHRLDDQI